MAWAGIADTYTLLAYYGVMRASDAQPRAEEASRLALEYGPDLAECNASRGLYELFLAWNWARAEELLSRSYALDPSYAQGTAWYCFFARGSLLGEWQEAVNGMTRLVARDPLSAYAQAISAACHAGGHMGDGGVAAAERAVALDPDAFASWHCGLMGILATNSPSEVRRYLDGAFATSGRSIVSLGLYAFWCVDQHDIEGAQLAFAELETRAHREPDLPCLRGALALLLGHETRGQALLLEAEQRRDPQICQYLHLDRMFPCLQRARAHPALRALEDRVGLTDFLRTRASRSSL